MKLSAPECKVIVNVVYHTFHKRRLTLSDKAIGASSGDHDWSSLYLAQFLDTCGGSFVAETCDEHAEHRNLSQALTSCISIGYQPRSCMIRVGTILELSSLGNGDRLNIQC
jgi:hypothetical protein